MHRLRGGSQLKVIQTDNFDTESVSDVLVAENVSSERLGKIMTDALNEKLSGSNSSVYFKLVEDDFKLFTRDY
ncbi:hypothetical protein LCGC14_2182840 [marine sediment metagenome]|uniref:Uncharacterized protein n=1 Tax=marine sediment metagenome TaxID=412755 RepID=A0A0F9GHJ5_9ZZZZ